MGPLARGFPRWRVVRAAPVDFVPFAGLHPYPVAAIFGAAGAAFGSAAPPAAGGVAADAEAGAGAALGGAAASGGVGCWPEANPGTASASAAKADTMRANPLIRRLEHAATPHFKLTRGPRRGF